MPTLHVHLDESGDLTFSPSGTKYYVFAVAWTYDPAPLAQAISTLRFALLKAGHNLPAFHATEDKQANRNAVVGALVQHANWNYIGVIVEKRKVNPSIRDPHVFYPKFASMPLKYVFRRLRPGTNPVLIFTDRLPLQKHRRSAEKAIKTAARACLPAGVRFEIYHHPLPSNTWIQVADYCCWALYRKWERGDPRTYNVLLPRLAVQELDVLQRGIILYY